MKVIESTAPRNNVRGFAPRPCLEGRSAKRQRQTIIEKLQPGDVVEGRFEHRRLRSFVRSRRYGRSDKTLRALWSALVQPSVGQESDRDRPGRSTVRLLRDMSTATAAHAPLGSQAGPRAIPGSR